MKTYLSYKNKIDGFKDVSETVKTVEKIAASSIHFLKSEVTALDARIDFLERVLSRLFLFYPDGENPLSRAKKVGERTILILTGDKGLVGGLWRAVIKSFLGEAEAYESAVVVGIKGRNYLKEESQNGAPALAEFFNEPRDGGFEEITDFVFDKFKKGGFSRVDILYPAFASLAEQKPAFIRFLPFKFSFAGKIPAAAYGLPIFEPSKKEIFNRLLRKYAEVFFRKIALEAKLSELSARTVAMERAGEKTDKIVKRISLNYLKERRRAITQSQLETFAARKAAGREQ